MLAIKALEASRMSYLTLYRDFIAQTRHLLLLRSGAVSLQKMECLMRRQLSPLPVIPVFKTIGVFLVVFLGGFFGF